MWITCQADGSHEKSQYIFSEKKKQKKKKQEKQEGYDGPISLTWIILYIALLTEMRF